MSKPPLTLSPDAIKVIENIVSSGGKKVEVEFGRDGVKVIEVQRKVVYPNK